MQKIKAKIERYAVHYRVARKPGAEKGDVLNFYSGKKEPITSTGFLSLNTCGLGILCQNKAWK